MSKPRLRYVVCEFVGWDSRWRAVAYDETMNDAKRRMYNLHAIAGKTYAVFLNSVKKISAGEWIYKVGELPPATNQIEIYEAQR